jgi:hypothetical protein
MLFFGYNMQLLPNGDIKMDEELSSENIQIKDGDKFVAEVVNGVITFKKIK